MQIILGFQSDETAFLAIERPTHFFSYTLDSGPCHKNLPVSEKRAALYSASLFIFPKSTRRQTGTVSFFLFQLSVGTLFILENSYSNLSYQEIFLPSFALCCRSKGISRCEFFFPLKKIGRKDNFPCKTRPNPKTTAIGTKKQTREKNKRAFIFVSLALPASSQCKLFQQ